MPPFWGRVNQVTDELNISRHPQALLKLREPSQRTNCVASAAL